MFDGPTSRPPDGWPPPPASARRGRGVVVLVVVLVLGLLASAAAAVVFARRAADADQRIAELQRELSRLRAQELFGEDGERLEELLTGGVPGAACFTEVGGGTPAAPAEVDPDDAVGTIAAQVAALRELPFANEVDATFLTHDELSAELTRLIDEDLDREQLELDQEVLVALGALPPGADLEELQRDLLDEQVAGLYDPDDERLLVLTPDDGTLGPLERVILAHELLHALTDQALGLPDLDDPEVDGDAGLATIAVIEGDASLLMNLWAIQHLSFREQLSMAADPEVLAQLEGLEDYPVFLQRMLLFPYTAGLDLVCTSYLDGGWEAVDALYTDPPATSAEVLFPERLGAPTADPPSLAPPPGGTERYVDTFGAAPLAWLFEAPGDDETRALRGAETRAGAWDAGELRSWHVDGELVVGLALRDRADGDAPRLCSSVTAWYEAAFPEARRLGSEAGAVFTGERTAVIACRDDEVRLAIAPDVATASAVVGG